MLSNDQATHLLHALDALGELEAAALKLVRSELACGPVVDGLIADLLPCSHKVPIFATSSADRSKKHLYEVQTKNLGILARNMNGSF